MSTHRNEQFRLLLLAGLICVWIGSCGGSEPEEPPAGCEPIEIDLDFPAGAFEFPPAEPVDAGEDRTVEVGERVELFATTDAEMVRWRFLKKPEGSVSEIDEPMFKDVSFIADEVGIYEVEVAAGAIPLLDDPEYADQDLSYVIATDTVEVTAFARDGTGGAGGPGGGGGAGGTGGEGGAGGQGRAKGTDGVGGIGGGMVADFSDANMIPYPRPQSST